MDDNINPIIGLGDTTGSVSDGFRDLLQVFLLLVG
jgi:hypothetical protein